MRYISAEEILVIHFEIVEQTGGMHGVRDVGLLKSISERPKAGFGGQELYKSTFEKGAAYVEALVKHHVFVDGNKRTGAVVAARFLFINGYELTASNKELEKFILEIANKKYDVQTIAGWLKEHAKRIPGKKSNPSSRTQSVHYGARN
jgi:death-on-curing protein